MSSIRFGSFFLFLRVVYVRSLHSVHASWIVGRASTLAMSSLLLDADDGAGADGPAALADGEALADLEGDRGDQLDGHLDVVAGHDHLGPVGQADGPGHVGRAKAELREVAVVERGVPAALLLGQDVDLRGELGVRLDRARLGQDLPALDLLALDAADEAADAVARAGRRRRRQPTLSPARPSSSSFLNISTPVMTTLRVGLTPTSSTSSPTLTMPRSMRPAATAPRPLMPNTSATGIRNGLSMSRSGVGM